MPPPNTPADAAAQPQRMTSPHHTNGSDSKPRIAKAFPTVFYALITGARVSLPLFALATISTLSPVRGRMALAWKGSVIPWPKVSKVLFWASLAGWLSGRALYVLTIAYWWSGGSADDLRRERREAGENGAQPGG